MNQYFEKIMILQDSSVLTKLKCSYKFLNIMSKLSSNQIKEYNDNGYVTPIDVLTKMKQLKLEKNKIYKKFLIMVHK
jgi:hypothetical protein